MSYVKENAALTAKSKDSAEKTNFELDGNQDNMSAFSRNTIEIV